MKKLAPAKRNGTDPTAIGAAYAESFTRLHGTTPRPEMAARFTTAILTRDAIALEYLANGLNEASKQAFSAVTGVALPKQQGQTWKAIRDWAGLSDEQERVRLAVKQVAFQITQLEGHFDIPATLSTINNMLDRGCDRIVNVDRQHYLVDSDGNGF